MPNPSQTMTHKTEPKPLRAILWSRVIPAHLIQAEDYDAMRDLPWTRVGTYVDAGHSWLNDTPAPRCSHLRALPDGRRVQLAHMPEPPVAACSCATRVWPSDDAQWVEAE